MAPENKRRLIAMASSQPSKKRQKFDSAHNCKPLVKRAVAVDELPWNEVQMPDMFDDAEGFYGLEEVEGVQIVHDGGTVQFVNLIYMK
jgi:ATP-dependent RNA helicase DDX24/MAK5